MKTYQLIHDCHQKYGWKIDLMCKWAKAVRSAYYKHFDPKRTISKRELRDQKIEAKIIEIAKSNNSLFGTEKMTMAVNRQMPGEMPVYHKTVYRLMCINGISSQKPRYRKPKFKPATPEKAAENKLKRDFNASKPNDGVRTSPRSLPLACLKHISAQCLISTIATLSAMPLASTMTLLWFKPLKHIPMLNRSFIAIAVFNLLALLFRISWKSKA